MFGYTDGVTPRIDSSGYTLVADSSRARLYMMPVELVCTRQVVDVSWTSTLRVNSGGAGGATSGVGLGGAGCATSGVDLGGVVTATIFQVALHWEKVQVAIVFPGFLQCESVHKAL